MEWQDRGVVLALRPHGEDGAVVTLLTADHGRHAGLARGVRSARRRGLFEPGNLLAVSWRARLEDSLGIWTAEILQGHAARALSEPVQLAVLSALCALCEIGLPERQAAPGLFAATAALLAGLGDPDLPARYAVWELALLADLGFGLDLSCCAKTGQTDDLAYVSPRSGRAVSRDAGAALADKLFALPGFLIGTAPAAPPAVLEALHLSGHFLERQALAPQGRRLPPARHRLLDRLARAATISG